MSTSRRAAVLAFTPKAQTPTQPPVRTVDELIMAGDYIGAAAQVAAKLLTLAEVRPSALHIVDIVVEQGIKEGPEQPTSPPRPGA